MNRIETALQALQEKKEKAFITYITAGPVSYTHLTLPTTSRV